MGLMSRAGRLRQAAGLRKFTMALALGELSSESTSPLCPALLPGCPEWDGAVAEPTLWKGPSSGNAQHGPCPE